MKGKESRTKICSWNFEFS